MSNETPPADAGPRDPRLFLQSVARAMRVLEAFATKRRPQSLGELSQAAGIDKSAVQRICYTLQALGYVEREGPAGGLRPGLRILERTFDYLRLHPLIERAVPVLAELRASTGLRVDLSLHDDLSMIYAVRLQHRRETFVAHLIGRRVPAYCSSGGRVTMAHLTDAEVDSILRRSDLRPVTPHTLTSPARIWEEIREARRRGVSVVAQEWVLGEIVLGPRHRTGRIARFAARTRNRPNRTARPN